MKDYSEDEIIAAQSVIMKRGYKAFGVFCVENKVDEDEAKSLIDYLGWLRFKSSIQTLRILKGIIN